MTEHRDASSDDELIARLRGAAGSDRPKHDPLMDLPIAAQTRVSEDQAWPDAAERCNAPGRRPIAIQGYFDVPVTEPVTCELRSGHRGDHRACFTRSRVLHHWQAFEWPDRVAGPA